MDGGNGGNGGNGENGENGGNGVEWWIEFQIKRTYLSKFASTDKHIVTRCISLRFELLQNSLNKYPVIRDKFIPKYYRYLIKKVTTFFVEIAFW